MADASDNDVHMEEIAQPGIQNEPVFVRIQEDGLLTRKVFAAVLQVLNNAGHGLENLRKPTRTMISNYEYEKLDRYGDLTPFDEEIYRHAYLYRLLIAHIMGFHQNCLEGRFRHFLPETSNDPLKVCAIGGGPATEAIALGMLLSNNISQDLTFEFSSLDTVNEWQHLWQPLYSAFEDGGLIRNRLTNVEEWRSIQYDFWDEALSPDAAQAISTAQIITMVKFLSTVAGKRTLSHREIIANAQREDENAAGMIPDNNPLAGWLAEKAAVDRRNIVRIENISKIFKLMQPGAILLYLDNNGGAFTEIMEAAENACADIIEKKENWYHPTVVDSADGVTAWTNEGWATADDKDQPLCKLYTRFQIYQKKSPVEGVVDNQGSS